MTYNAQGLRASYSVTPYGGSSPSLADLFTYRGSQLAQTAVVSGTTAYTYVYSQHGMPLELLRTTSGGTNRYWYQRDGQGNVVALTDVSGNVVDQYAYDLWGKPTLFQETVPQQLRYQGYWYDNELGWYWLATRSYDPGLERFPQPDPCETDGLFSYVYAGDDPVDGSDPSGFMATTHPGDCGPDEIYCGGLPDYQEAAPTGPSDPCYYNTDACAPESHVTSPPEASPVSGGLVSLGTTTSQVTKPAGINIPNVDLRTALFGPFRDKVIPRGTYTPGSTVFAIAAVGPGMGRMVINYSYAEPGDARTQDAQGNVRPVRITQAPAEIVFMKPCPDDDVCAAYGYFAPGVRITLASLYWYSPAEFYARATKWYQTLPASLLRKYPPQPGQTIGINLD